MTTKELIKELRKMPQNETVYVATLHQHGGANRHNIGKVVDGGFGVYIPINI